MFDPMLDVQRWMLVAGDRGGNCITSTHHGIANAILHMRSLEGAGYTTFLLQKEPDRPLPDAMLVPCAQPDAQQRMQPTAEGQAA